MMPTCARCERELADGAYVCAACAQNLAADLTRAAGHADDAPAVVARQVRYGPGGGRSNEQPLPFDVRASEDLWAVENTITTWVRHVEEERGIAFEAPSSHVEGRSPLDPYSPLGSACRWLSGNVEWLRHRPEAAEAFDELDDACRMLRRLVDRPADRVLVGKCNCGRILYAPEGRETIACPEPGCGLTWDVEETRTHQMREALDDHLVTAAEAGRLLGYLGTDRTQEQLRKLVTKWGERGLVEIRGVAGWRDPTEAEIDAAKKKGQKPPEQVAIPNYRFGDVAVRLAQTPRRERRMAA